jgi:hypothetical protein
MAPIRDDPASSSSILPGTFDLGIENLRVLTVTTGKERIERMLGALGERVKYVFVHGPSHTDGQ